MDDIADIYFMGMDFSFIGRHHVQQSFHHRNREDQLASTAMPSLGGFGVAELEPFESQERGFEHGHRKKYAIPKSNEREVIEKFTRKNETELLSHFEQLKVALIRCAETLQYEASTLPAKQMGQIVPPEKFTEKQQKQSRLDGGIELDGSHRQLLPVTAPELLGHHVLEKRKAHAEGREAVSMYSQASLKGCHQSLMPSYRLPQKLGARKVLDERGMHCVDEVATPGAFPPHWELQEEKEYVRVPSTCPTPAGLGNVAQPASREDITQDAKQFALSFCRDFRALHQFNHDHDCTTTCIKYVAKQCKDAAQEALRKGKVVACRFFFFHILVFTYVAMALHGIGETITKRIRRRGKKLVSAPYIAITNERNEFCKPILQRDTPFRSASTDVGQDWGRCNIDFQFMPRTIDPSHFMEASAESSCVLQVNPEHALPMYGVRNQMPKVPMLRRTFHALVAMFQAAHNCDFYITKYHAKPMAQLQSLLVNIATGLRRLHAEEEAAQDGAGQPVNAAEERTRKTTIKIANAANRSSWCSCCEMATFIKTGALARKTHRPIMIFLSRPLYLYEQCKRLLQSSPEMLIEAQIPWDDQPRHVDVLCFTSTDNAVPPAAHDTNEPDTDSAALPGAVEADAENEEQDVHSNSSEEDNPLNDGGDPEHGDDLETDSAVHPADTDTAERPLESPPIANSNNDEAQDDAGNGDESLDIVALEATTSVHDDWLHRGPFLFDMDLHTYTRFTVRKPYAKDRKVSDVDRAQHCFRFDSHYALAASHWQQLVTDGHARLVVMEALKCPLASLNNGEDNAVFKSLIGTLIKCPGPGRCADPLFCKAGFFQVTVPESSNQTAASELPHWIEHVKCPVRERFCAVKCPLSISRKTHADDAASTFSCRLQWKARRAEIEVLATQAADLSNDAKRIPVLADTTLLRGWQSGSAVRPARTTAHEDSAEHAVQSAPKWRLLLCLTQMWMKKCGQAFPPFAPKVLECIGSNIHHRHQMSLAQFSAYHLREIIYNLDMLAIARTTKLTTTTKEKIEDEATEPVNASGPPVETEFHGGEQIDEPEDEDLIGAETWRSMFGLSLDRAKAVLRRETEVAAAAKKGPKSAVVVQMKQFHDRYHRLMNTPLPPLTVEIKQTQHLYAQPHLINGALLHQDAILKEMRTVQNGGNTEMQPETDIAQAVLHNLRPRSRTAEWIDLPSVLKGPLYVAKLLIKKTEEERSTPGKPYRVNAEQLEHTALFVDVLEKGFERRPDISKPWLRRDEVLMTIISDGGGGCGKTTLAMDIILPLLECYFHPEGVLRRAPSNKPARIILGRTMHSGQGMTPENSMRTASLALNPQSKQKLSITHEDAGVLYIDESSQLQAELNHAAALRTTYSREAKYEKVNRNNYFGPLERYGRMPILWYSADAA